VCLDGKRLGDLQKKLKIFEKIDFKKVDIQENARILVRAFFKASH
jgi:hypothetical protein